MGVSVWTSREVHFTCYPRTPDADFEAFMDALAEHFYERWWWRHFRTLHIGSTGLVMHVGGFPWWMPKWRTRSLVASIAATSGVGGGAVSVIERAVLHDEPPTPADQPTPSSPARGEKPEEETP